MDKQGEIILITTGGFERFTILSILAKDAGKVMMFIACCNGDRPGPRCLAEVAWPLLALTHGRWMLAEGWLHFACAIGWGRSGVKLFESHELAQLSQQRLDLSMVLGCPVAHSVASILQPA